MKDHEHDEPHLPCRHCEGQEQDLTTECPGKPLTDEQREEIEAGSLDYHRGKWWIADTELRHSVEAEPVTLTKSFPCGHCGCSPSHFSDGARIILNCSNPDCQSGYQVYGVHLESVIAKWNSTQKVLAVAHKPPLDLVSPEPTPTLPKTEKIVPGLPEASLRERVDKLEQTVDDILRGRVFRRH